MKSFKSFIFIAAVILSLTAIYSFYQKNNPKSALTNNPAQPASENAAVNDPSAQTEAEIKRQAAENYGRLPMNFEPNAGQTDERVKFLARGQGYSLFLTETEAVLALKKDKRDELSVVRMQVEGANTSPKISGLNQVASNTNYFIGNDSQKWQTGVANYSRVKYEAVYDGVDVVYYGNGQRLEYDFLVAPNADPQQIKLKFGGVKTAKIEKETGDLLLETDGGTLRQHAPVVYQNIDGERRTVAASYSIQNPKSEIRNPKSNGFSVSFSIGEYDKSKELVIDPILAYGSYLGGTYFDEARAITVDAQGSAYLVGTTFSLNFPTTAGTVKPAMLTATNGTQFWYDAFVAKVNPAGTALVFSTYYGGRNNQDTGSGVAVDGNGNVLISGTTMAADFPTVNAYQSTFGGTDDAFAAKLNSTGSAIIYSTYLGGNNTDLGGKIALNTANGDAVFAGTTSSGNFPTTPGAFKPQLCNNTPGSCNGIFYSGSYVVKLSATGSAVYATLFDAGFNDVALDASNNAVLAGTGGTNSPTTAGAFQPASSGGVDGYIAKLNPAGSAQVFGTFLGGGLQSDRINSIALDADGNMYVTGQTQNTAFPTTGGAFDRTYNGGEDAFVTKLNAAGSALVYSTFLGGTAKDQAFGIALGSGNSAFVAGETLSPNTFPLKNSINGTNGTIFVTHLNADGTALVYSTLLGQGGAYDIAADGANNAYVTGHTTSVVVTPNAFQPMKGEATSTSSAKDAFVVKLAPTDETTPTYNISGTVTDPTQSGNNYQPIVVTVTGTVQRSIVLPYGSGNGVIPYFFGSLPSGGNYTVTARKAGFLTEPESVTFNNLGANQFADFTIVNNEQPEGVITSPEHGTIFNAPATINITATATDPDGDAITKVDFVAYSSEAGSVYLGTDTTAPYEFTWTNVPLGTWSLNAIPTDDKGLRGVSVDVVHIHVVDPTGANVSITGPTEGQTFTQGEYVPIAVNVSSSVNLVEVRDQNGNLVARMTGAPWASQWRVMNAGTYTLTANAWTQTNQMATSTPVTFTVAPINHRINGRVVSSITNAGIAGVTLNLTSPTNPAITATTTTDSNGSYLFTGLGTTPDDGVVITPSGNYTFDPPVRNIAYLGYIEWQNQYFFATPQTQISVALTSPTNGQIFTAPATINLAATASSGAGTINKVEFLRRNLNGSTVLLATDTTAPFEHQLTGIAVGNYTYLARATDSTEAVAESENVGVTVRLQTVNLSGRVTDQAGNGMPNVEVYVGGGYAWSVTTNAEGDFAFTNLPGGQNYYVTPQPANTITFTPTSRSYTNVTSDIASINFVGSPPNQSPSPQFLSPTNGGTYSMSQPIALQVQANDPDNNVTHFSVVANNGSFSQTIAQVNTGTINTLWQPSAPGNYTLTAIVRDGGPVQTTVQIQITVTPPAPVAVAGRIVDRNSVGIEGVTVELKDYPAEENVVGTATTDANGNYTIANIPTFRNYILKASKQDYTFSPPQRLYFNLRNNLTDADFTGTLQVPRSDFDGDGGSDIAVWRPSDGVWHVQRSADNSYGALQFGGAAFGDVAVPGNYDGDKETDYAVYRNGLWYIRQSSNAVVSVKQFGLADDKPVAGDYDGDGKTDVAVWRPSNGVWYIWRSSDGGYDYRQFGLNGDLPLSGDYDGDGKTDTAIWRPANGVWYVQISSDGSYRSYQFGLNGDIPLVGDFDGDKRADYTIFRPANGVWYVNTSSNNDFKIIQWGIASDIPVPADFDRDGKTDFGVFRPTEGNWYVFKSSTNSYIVRHFGANGDMPIPAAYR